MWRWIARMFRRRNSSRTRSPESKMQHDRPGLLGWLKLRLRRVWLHWDRYPKDGTVIRPFCGVIELHGWAVATDGVRSIEVYCDDQLLGRAAVGLRRPDVFRSFPHARGSRRGGFQFVFETTRVPNGHHRLTLKARSKKGRTGQLTAAIYVRNLAGRD